VPPFELLLGLALELAAGVVDEARKRDAGIALALALGTAA
jgi:hypothetical protein